MNDHLQILGAQLSFERDDATSRIVISKKRLLDNQTKIQEQNLLAQLSADLKRLANAEATFQFKSGSWPAKVKDIVQHLTVYLRDIHVEISESQKKIVLALRLELKPQEMKNKTKLDVLRTAAPFNLITFESLCITIWNTDNPEIIKEMNIIDFGNI